LLTGYAGELIRLFGMHTNLCINNMKILCVNNYYSNEKSVSRLGLNYRPVDVAISEAIAYFKENRKLLKQRNNALIDFNFPRWLCRLVGQSASITSTRDL